MNVATLTLGLALIAPGAPAVDTLAEKAAMAQRSGRSSWLAWSVPSATDGVACCGNGRSRDSRTCSLSTTSYGTTMSNDDGPMVDPTLMVYAHIDAKGIDKIRVFSSSCRVDRAGETVQDLANISPADSVSYLESLVKVSEAERATKRRSEGALMAIAMHDDKSADGALERVARESDSKSLRHSAAFWLGNTREGPGYEALVRLRSSTDAAFREQLTFAFSQSKAAGAPAALIDMARNDASPKVRGQALFWISQRAQTKAEKEAIRGAVSDDPDVDVKKKAVFALSQIPNGEGVPELIRVARENKTPAVRKQAMFWLGQSKDPRALAFFKMLLRQ